MPVAPIPPIQSFPSTSSAGAAGGASDPLVSTGAVGSDNFANQIGSAIDQLQSVQNTASTDEAQAASGQGNLADTMIAATEASLDTQVSTALINKAVASYNDIMAMTI